MHEVSDVWRIGLDLEPSRSSVPDLQGRQIPVLIALNLTYGNDIFTST